MDKNILALIPINPKDRIGMQEVQYTPYPGSGRVQCDICKVPCWIGPKQTVAKVNNLQMPALCMMCAIEEIKKDKIQPRIVPLRDD